jgi:hypothetical protein
MVRCWPFSFETWLLSRTVHVDLWLIVKNWTDFVCSYLSVITQLSTLLYEEYLVAGSIPDEVIGFFN